MYLARIGRSIWPSEKEEVQSVAESEVKRKELTNDRLLSQQLKRSLTGIFRQWFEGVEEVVSELVRGEGGEVEKNEEGKEEKRKEEARTLRSRCRMLFSCHGRFQVLH